MSSASRPNGRPTGSALSTSVTKQAEHERLLPRSWLVPDARRICGE
jgi:hypothetical protein